MNCIYVASACLFASFNAASAQETGLPLWAVGLVAGAINTLAYPASSDRSSRALALPFLIYRGEFFRADRGGVGARMVHTDGTSYGLVLTWTFGRSEARAKD